MTNLEKIEKRQREIEKKIDQLFALLSSGSSVDINLSLDEAAAFTGYSRRSLEEEIEAGNLGREKRGRAVMIPYSELERWRKTLFIPAKNLKKVA